MGDVGGVGGGDWPLEVDALLSGDAETKQEEELGFDGLDGGWIEGLGGVKEVGGEGDGGVVVDEDG